MVVGAADVVSAALAEVVASCWVAVVVGVLVDVSASVVETGSEDGVAADSDDWSVAAAAVVGSAAAVAVPVLLTFDEDMVNCLAPFTPEKCLRRDMMLAGMHRRILGNEYDDDDNENVRMGEAGVKTSPTL